MLLRVDHELAGEPHLALPVRVDPLVVPAALEGALVAPHDLAAAPDRVGRHHEAARGARRSRASSAPTSPHRPSSSWPETIRKRTGPSARVPGAVTGSVICASGETSFQVGVVTLGSVRCVGSSSAMSGSVVTRPGAAQRAKGYFCRSQALGRRDARPRTILGGDRPVFVVPPAPRRSSGSAARTPPAEPAPRTSAIEARSPAGCSPRAGAGRGRRTRARAPGSGPRACSPGPRTAERVVAEVGVAERPAEDLREVDDADDRAVLVAAHEHALVGGACGRGAGTPRTRRRGRVDPRGVERPARLDELDEPVAVAGGRTAQVDALAAGSEGFVTTGRVRTDRTASARAMPPRSPGRRSRGPRSRRSRPCALRGPCRPGRSARSRSAGSAGARRGR